MKKYIIGGLGGLVVLAVFATILLGSKANANPISYVRGNTANLTTTNASNTPTYMTPGTATTTLVANAYASGRVTGFDTLAFAVQLTATTGIPTLNIACERSANNIDWYPSDCYSTGTTTPTANLTVPFSSFTWIFASSTCAVGGASPSPTQSRCHRLFEVKALSQYTRLVLSLASTTAVSTRSDDADVWAEFIGGKEI